VKFSYFWSRITHSFWSLANRLDWCLELRSFPYQKTWLIPVPTELPILWVFLTRSPWVEFQRYVVTTEHHQVTWLRMCDAAFSRAMKLSGVVLNSAHERVLRLIFLPAINNFFLYTFCLLLRHSSFPAICVSFSLYVWFVFFPPFFLPVSILPTQDI